VIGETIGKYKVIERISQSGMATVYKALHPELNRLVAIKVLDRALLDSPEMLARFRREAQAIAALQHPHIVQVFDFDTVDGVYFMVMEYIEGETLAQRLTRLRWQGERMALVDVLGAVAEVGRALHFAHEQGMLHRDIKPSNIMFRADGRAVLTDFGVAKMLNVSTEITTTGAVAGTPAYMAPEQWTDDRPDRRSDIYSLGVVLYQAATGELPFTDTTPGRLMYKHISEPPPLPRTRFPGIPADLERVILHTLAKAPQHRYQTARELADDLESILYQLESTALTGIFERPVLRESAGETQKSQPRRPRSIMLRVGIVAVILLMAFLGVLVGSGLGGSSVPTVTPDVTGTALAARLAILEATLSVTPTPLPPPPSATPTAVQPIPTGAPAVPTLTKRGVDTPTLSPTACVLSATLARDVNFYNANWWNLAGASFYKVWRLRNDGACPWPSDTVLVHLDGEDFGQDAAFAVGTLGVGEEKELTLPLRAPSVPGVVAGRFQLQVVGGQSIGEPLSVEFKVRERVPPTPTVAPVVEPVRMAGFALVEWSADLGKHIWRGKISLWATGGNGQYTWYRDTLDNPLPGDVLEFEWGMCSAFFGSVWVTSGDSMDHESLYVPYPEPCD